MYAWCVLLNRRHHEVREAVVHFELYRVLKNSISSNAKFDRVRFTDVEPEKPVGGKSADLVVKADLKGSSTDFLVIEVKRRTRDGLLLFGSPSIDQIKEYAKGLSAVYYAITDGLRLRLFRTLNNEALGNYIFSTDENAVGQLLKTLSSLQVGEVTAFPFSTFKDPTKELEKRISGFSKVLVDLFNELSGKGAIAIEKHGKTRRLSIGPHSGVLRLGLDEQTSKNIIEVELGVLKKALGLDRSVDMIEKLSEIPGFEWVRDRTDFNKNFIYIYVRDVIAEEPDLIQAKEDLRKWILELDETVR